MATSSANILSPWLSALPASRREGVISPVDVGVVGGVFVEVEAVVALPIRVAAEDDLLPGVTVSVGAQVVPVGRAMSGTSAALLYAMQKAFDMDSTAVRNSF